MCRGQRRLTLTWALLVRWSSRITFERHREGGRIRRGAGFQPKLEVSMPKLPLRRASVLSLAIAAALAAPSAHANWPMDPDNPLLVAQHNAGNQTTPHMV